jgi:hypothetical protein
MTTGVAHRIGVLGVLLVCAVTAARAQGLPASDIRAVDAFTAAWIEPGDPGPGVIG